MSILGILIGTGIVWGLTALLVVPLAKALTLHKHHWTHPPVGVGENGRTVTAEEEIDTGYFILADVIVLSVAGLVIGWAVGWFFIGITWHAKNWPGLIAFIIASLIGSALHG
jgi:hypothetical protein